MRAAPIREAPAKDWIKATIVVESVAAKVVGLGLWV
jgi:hypothetical protein